MPDYSKAKIYKIVSDVDDEVYIGATCGSLAHRMSVHRATSRNKPERCLYAHVDALGGWQHFSIILVEDFPCERKEQLSARERYWVEEMSTLNMCIPGRTVAEYNATHRDKHNARRREYNATHHDKHIASARAWRAAHRDELNKYARTRRAAHKAAASASSSTSVSPEPEPEREPSEV